MSTPRLIVILGPTASGKTAASLELAAHLQGAVISADSRQLYAGMNIGTAKPEFAWRTTAHDVLLADTATVSASPEPAGDVIRQPAESEVKLRLAQLDPEPVERVKHYLFNVRTPENTMTLWEWQEAAFSAVDHVIANHQQPLLVGGTMLYIDSVVENYNIPHVEPSPDLRSHLELEDVLSLYARLIAADPGAQDFVQPGNKRRIIRALEVVAATGQPFSQQRRQRPPRYAVRLLGIFPGWDELHLRITARIAMMFDEGLLEETQELITTYGPDLPLLATLNYRQARAVLEGKIKQPDAIQDMISANVKYARRQMSWWRRSKDIHWLETADITTLKEAIA